ncbi:AI-2E family transporter [Puia dinghuensis]|uniref:AI-2E family transporter n=1 Tax=Puia dinghuensis TaxID=1792502 RepID=A0A8J2XU29_9BACT|nr:AI-2E family transporter [Puia dinghuensis]GGB22325.1 AI-2E family transporter [Puia dinghuensis]
MNKPFPNSSRSMIETILVVLLLLGLTLAVYDVLRVFFGILTFALIFSVSFAGVFEWLAKLLGGRRVLASIIYTIVLIAIIALPITLIISALRHHVKEAIAWMNDIKTNGLPPLPAWITRLPLVGEDISTFWQQLQSSPRETIVSHGEPIRATLRHILTSGAGIVGTGLQFIAGVIISAFLLVSGEKMLSPVKAVMQHLLGRREGLSLIQATTVAIKSVSIGVMGTAFIASIISWLGLIIAGIHYAILLSALIFFLVLIQLGPLLVWVPLVIWTASQGHTGMTVFLIIYGIALLIIDGLLKPVLIAKSGGKLPFLVLFLGVVGGLAAWGFTGMFKGAIILSVSYTLFDSWLEKRNDSGVIQR